MPTYLQHYTIRREGKEVQSKSYTKRGQRQRYGNEAGDDKLEVSSLMTQGGWLASFLFRF